MNLNTMIGFRNSITCFALYFLLHPLSKSAFAAESSSKSDGSLSPLLISKPALTLQIKDSSQIYRYIRKNDWWSDFKKTNLYRGLLEEVGPLFFLLGSNFHEAWTGRFIEFLSDKIFTNDPLAIHYFGLGNLNSPFGFVVHDKDSTKSKLASTLLTHALGDKVLQKMLITTNIEETFEIQPFRIHTQKFAFFKNKDCTGLSKDPRVVIMAVRNCDSAFFSNLEEDGKITLSIQELFPQVAAFLTKYLGLKEHLEIFLKYQSWDHYLRPVAIKWGQNGSQKAVLSATYMEDVLDILPANAMFFATIALPWPQNFSLDGIKDLLEKGPANENIEVKPVTLVSWRKKASPSGTTHLTAIILQDSHNQIQFEELTKIFTLKSPAEIKFGRFCQQFVIITPYDEALHELQLACEKKVPVMTHKIPILKKQITGRKSAGLIHFDLSQFFQDALHFGTIRGNEKESSSPELSEAANILGHIGSFSYVGTLEKDFVNFEEIR